MKKLILSLTLLSMPLYAQFISTEQPITVEYSKTLPDEAKVVLHGKIQKELKDEKYMFSDSTGSIKVEIDDDIWQGTKVGPNDTIEIVGEIDKDWYSSKRKIDVKSVKIVK